MGRVARHNPVVYNGLGELGLLMQRNLFRPPTRNDDLYREARNAFADAENAQEAWEIGVSRGWIPEFLASPPFEIGFAGYPDGAPFLPKYIASFAADVGGVAAAMQLRQHGSAMIERMLGGRSDADEGTVIFAQRERVNQFWREDPKTQACYVVGWSGSPCATAGNLLGPTTAARLRPLQKTAASIFSSVTSPPAILWTWALLWDRLSKEGASFDPKGHFAKYRKVKGLISDHPNPYLWACEVYASGYVPDVYGSIVIVVD